MYIIGDIHIGALIEVKKRTKCEVAATEFSGILFVRVNSARNLPSLDVGSQSDPYVVVCLKDGHQKMQTKTVQNNNNAVWNETLKLNYRSLQTDVLELSVWDSDILKAHDIIGRCQVCMSVCHTHKTGTHVYNVYSSFPASASACACNPPAARSPSLACSPNRVAVITHTRHTCRSRKNTQIRLADLLKAHGRAEVMQTPADRPHQFTLNLTGDGSAASANGAAEEGVSGGCFSCFFASRVKRASLGSLSVEVSYVPLS
jgi:hypothetical protein